MDCLSTLPDNLEEKVITHFHSFLWVASVLEYKLNCLGQHAQGFVCLFVGFLGGATRLGLSYQSYVTENMPARYLKGQEAYPLSFRSTQ